MGIQWYWILLAILVGGFIGVISGGEAASNRYRAQDVERWFAAYDVKTGEWRWLESTKLKIN